MVQHDTASGTARAAVFANHKKTIVKKLLLSAVLSLPLPCTLGAGAALAATDNPGGVVKTALADQNAALVRPAGYYLPNGVYVATCRRVVVGYSWNGWPIVRRFCR